MIREFVILGATGDLTSRKLMPALAELHAAGKLPAGFRVVGVARRPWDTETFRRHIAAGLERHARDVPADSRQALLGILEYRRADMTDRGRAAALFQAIRQPIAVYLALPPQEFEPILAALADIGLPEGSRVVVEKPFGSDLASAQALNRLLHRSFSERSVFRTDHFLHKQTVQNVLGLRFANRVFEYLWDRDHIERIEIIWDETLTLEGRASYYDRAGALRDMVQNHLLQLLCLVGMEAPLALDERELRDRKMDVLRAVRRLSPEEIRRHTIRARYAAGQIGNRAVKAYVEEEGIDPARNTETFAQVTFWIDNWRWADVPFVLRSGKALARDRREIALHFRPVPHMAFEAQCPAPNLFCLQLDPDRAVLGVNLNGHGNPFDLERVQLVAEFAPQDLPAYARLVLDVLEGEGTLSIRADEAEESWRLIEPVLNAWQANDLPLLEYKAGSDGPSSAV
jgi:glucose-6-phosphate 1-dehydrogenase